MKKSASRWEMIKPGTPLARSEFNPFPPSADEVIVEISGCGVCHTDLGYYYDGVRTNKSLPLTLGHEISGKVVAAGEAAQSLLDASVVVYSVIPCGECDPCRRGNTRICRQQRMPGNDIDGGFASHIKVPANGVVVVDDEALAASGLELADLSVVADAVTTPYQAVVGSGLSEGDLAIVIGVGGVGGYAVQIAKALGATVVAVDVDQEKLDLISHYGAAETFNAREVGGRDLKRAISAFVKEKGLRPTEWRIFECSGTTRGQDTAFGLLTHGATLCVVGFTMDKLEVRLSNLMAFDARAIGNWGCAATHYPAAIDLVLSGRVQVLPFTEKFPLDRINEVFEAVHAKRQTRRAIMVP